MKAFATGPAVWVKVTLVHGKGLLSATNISVQAGENPAQVSGSSMRIFWLVAGTPCWSTQKPQSMMYAALSVGLPSAAWSRALFSRSRILLSATTISVQTGENPVQVSGSSTSGFWFVAGTPCWSTQKPQSMMYAALSVGLPSAAWSRALFSRSRILLSATNISAQTGENPTQVAGSSTRGFWFVAATPCWFTQKPQSMMNAALSVGAPLAAMSPELLAV